jgi:diguanylate cyclase
LRWSESRFIFILKDTALMGARALAEEALFAMSQRRLRLRDSGEPVGVVTASAEIVVGQNEMTTDVLERAGANLASALRFGGNRVSG